MKPETMQANHHKPLQTTTKIWIDGYSCAGKKQLFCLSYGSFKVAIPCWWSTMLLRIPIIPNPACLRCISGGLWWFEAACGDLRQTTTNHYRNAVNMQNLGRCVFMCRWIGCRACFVWCAMFHGDTCTVSIITWGLNRYGHFNDVILNWHQV